MQLATLLIGLISATALWSGVQALNQQAATATTARPPRLAARERRRWSAATAHPSRSSCSSTCAAPAGRCRPFSSHPDRRRGFRLLGIEPVTLPAEVGNAPAIGRAGLQSFVTPPENAGGTETLAELACRKALQSVHSSARFAARTGSRVMVVDIGIASGF